MQMILSWSLQPTAKGLQHLILLCEQYASNCDIVFNISKTKYMCIKPASMKNLHVPKIFLNGKSIDYVTSYKYLGFMMCDDGKDDESVTAQIRGLYSRGNALIKHFKFCSDNVKILLFKTFCSSFYCVICGSCVEMNHIEN